LEQKGLSKIQKAIAYLDFGYKSLGGLEYSILLLFHGDLLMANVVVSPLMAHVHTLLWGY
jgi:hypothetical protein